jgi:hypothetical protein
LAKYLKSIGKLKKVLVPNENKYSNLLNRLNESNLRYVDYISRDRYKLTYPK